MSDREEIEGIQLPQVEDWIAAHTDVVKPPFKWTRLTGGTSNLTYGIEDTNGARAVVRRPPTGKLLPKAHDMEREHKILAGLAPTPVRVAEPYALCTDAGVTGAPFYVMAYSDGRALKTANGGDIDVPRSVRAKVGDSMIDALVELHKHDPADIGLDRLGRPDGYIARQLNRWYDSWQRSHPAAQIDIAYIDEAFEILSSQIPEQGPARVCHGDYGPHNVLIDDVGDVAVITDWEISTLGDPLADVMYFVRIWAEDAGSPDGNMLQARRGEGYATRQELIDRYEKVSGRTINDVWFYLAFNNFKSCCIGQGVYARFVSGVRGTQGRDLNVMRERIIERAGDVRLAIEQI